MFINKSQNNREKKVSCHQTSYALFIKGIISFSTSTERIERKMSDRYLYTSVHSSIIHNTKRWKQLKCVSMDKYMHKIYCVHTLEYY
jgi:hypothetical protein